MNIVYLGGFGAGRSSVELTAEQLARSVGALDYDAYTFNDRRRRLARIVVSINNADFIGTHSAGAIVAAQAEEASTHRSLRRRFALVNAPVPTSPTRLIIASPAITANMAVDALRHPRTMLPTVLFGASYTAEMLAHPFSNLRAVLGEEGEIPKFNSNEAAEYLNRRSSGVLVVDTEEDEYFERPRTDVEHLGHVGVKHLMLPGHHNRFPVDVEAMSLEADLANFAQAPTL